MTDQGELGRRIARQLGALTLEKVVEIGFRNAETNAARIESGHGILGLRDTPLMDGDAAIVLAAGPSLHRATEVEELRALQGKATLIAAESVLSYCFRNDLVPDLIVTLDPHPTRIVRCFGDPHLTAEMLVQDDYFERQDFDPGFALDQLRFNAELLASVDAHGPAIRAAISSSASPAAVDRVYASRMQPYWWNPYYDDYDLPDSLTRKIHRMNGLPCLNAGGNVGTAAWVIAQTVLRKSKVALVGMDLGYYADTPYENTQYYYELIDAVGADRLDEAFIQIHNPWIGADFYTDPAYLWYRECFLELARDAECETFNCTGGGILFGEGIRFVPLSEFAAAIAGESSGTMARSSHG